MIRAVLVTGEDGVWGNCPKRLSAGFGGDHIRVHNKLPGFVDAPTQPAKQVTSRPLGRMGTVAEVSAAISFLAPEGEAYITRQNLRVDGGETRSV